MPPKSTTKSKGSLKKGPKTAKKQPLSVPERLKRLFTSLCAQIDGGYFNNALKTCDKILRLEANDPDARQTKLFLLLQTEQYDAALELIDSDAESSSSDYEKAYALYRLHRESEARETISLLKAENGESDRGVVHLEAQLSYREGDYQAAFDFYNALLDTADANTEEHSDILTNLQAAEKHLDFINTGFLHAVDALPTSLTASLETAPPPAHVTSAVTSLSTASAIANASAENQVSKPLKKVRMKRVPKGVTPGVTPPPDPERWLKKSERSTYNQSRRRKGAGGGATQGASVGDVAHQAPVSHPAKSGGAKSKKKKN